MTAEFPKFYVVTVYTPNAKDDLSRLRSAVQALGSGLPGVLQAAGEEQAGDFLRRPQCGAYPNSISPTPSQTAARRVSTDEEREGFQNFVDAGFIDTFRQFTQGNGHYSWWSHFANSRARNIGWRIDYVLVSRQLRDAVKRAEIHPTVLGSDHCPVSITLDA